MAHNISVERNRERIVNRRQKCLGYIELYIIKCTKRNSIKNIIEYKKAFPDD